MAEHRPDRRVADDSVERAVVEDRTERGVADRGRERAVVDGGGKRSVTDHRPERRVADDGCERTVAEHRPESSVADDGRERAVVDEGARRSTADRSPRMNLAKVGVRRRGARSGAQRHTVDDGLPERGVLGVPTTYLDLGVRPVINAAATLTRLGGSRMPPRVVDAMRAGAESFVDVHELQRAVGDRIAELTGNEACFVSSGAAAGIAIAVAACIAGTDAERAKRLPEIDGVAPEVIVFGSQRTGYDQAARLPGARLVEIGADPRELEQAIGERTVCVLYFAGAHLASGALSLEQVVAIAGHRHIRVLVDAAAQIPPIGNLWHFTRELGADAAIFSGGKGLRGPQSTGLVLGRRDVIEACRVHGSPNHSLGRPMKVGKEEMLGILAAVEWSLEQDETTLLAQYEATVERWVHGLRGIPGVRVERGFPSEAAQPHARAILSFEPTMKYAAAQVVTALWEGEPRIAVGTIGESAIALNPQTLEPGEEEIVLDALLRILR